MALAQGREVVLFVASTEVVWHDVVNVGGWSATATTVVDLGAGVVVALEDAPA